MGGSRLEKGLGNALSGAAGEYLVAAELSRRGYVASLTRQNARKIDILVSNADGSHSAAIQVKTNQGYWRRWRLGADAERWQETSWFYVFVNLNGLEMPSYYIVPSAVVAQHVKERHERRVANGGRDDNLRDFRPADWQDYDNSWALLQLD